ncbi:MULTISPECIES: septum formation family protein [unclassified Rathayibacter]|uniref:septum formation family protein n=1 Tax=unclassified Rathayibacter TaxID=2609250 RepID=UPI00188BC0CD|nr:MULTISPECIES: septum formation family protein [unclassified Rathayibacter]MBF4461341.1 septum formation family protein [Rathayibacter sp. VKM Ac-2879]MBF4502752.1 septum formation family protein [Rathayibacter sp. VKM Ac-2878]
MNRRRPVVLAVGAALVLGLTGCSGIASLLGGETRDEQTGEITEGGTTDVFQLRVGDCLNDELTETATEVTDVPTVPCSEPHAYEVFQNVTMTDADDYPGSDATTQQAETDCGAAFESFVGASPEESDLDFSYYYPTQESWDSGDRTINCLATDPSGLTAGSLAGSAS